MRPLIRRTIDVSQRTVVVVWRHVSVLVALALIIAAFVIGHRIGRPAPEPATDRPAEVDSGAHAEASAPQLYTCSMHPAVRLPDPKAKCPICFMDLIPVGADEGEGSERRVSMSAEAAALSRIETARAARFFPEAEVRLYGTLTYDETAIARLTAYAPGRIERLFVNFLGVRVSAGDHLAELYSPQLLAAFEELRQANAAVEAIEAIGGAPGGSELVRRTTRDTLVAARERLRLLGVTDEQIRAIDDGSFEGDRLTIHAPLGGVVTELAVREGDYVETGSPLATVADLSRLWLDLAAYESQLPLLHWGAPVDFTVQALPGDRFQGRIAFIEPLVDARRRAATVRVAVDNAEGRLKPGMFATAVARVRIDERGAVLGDDLAGRWVSPMHPTIVKDEPGTCDVCGMDLVSAESLGIVGDPSAAIEPLVVPRSAVLYTGPRSIVYVAVEDAERPTYEAREVVLGPRAGDLQIIREGLAVGESVVVRGAFRIDSAMQIAAKPSMMSMAAATADTRHRVPAHFLHALKPVYAAYLEAQEALADDDLDGFRLAVGDIDTALGFVDEAGVVGAALGDWRRAMAQLRGVDASGTIDEARVDFERMSIATISLLRRFGHDGAEVWHLAHCPMAFDDRGADWIQRGTRIANSYFGAEMLRCGEIRESFSPVGAAPNGESIRDDAMHDDANGRRRRGVAPVGGHRHE